MKEDNGLLFISEPESILFSELFSNGTFFTSFLNGMFIHIAHFLLLSSLVCLYTFHKIVSKLVLLWRVEPTQPPWFYLPLKAYDR